MAKFVYSYDTGDGYTYSATDYIAFESESKETLATELGCSLIDFCNKVKEINLDNQKLEKKRMVALRGAHKKSPDMEEYRKISLEIMEKEKSVKEFEFKGKKYDTDCFFESVRNESDDIWELEIKPIEGRIQTLDEWFEGMK